jgi:CheY-like chemotaxis protein/signal transduction histidine kinase
MERSDLRVFLEKAASQLAGIRGGLLLAAQNGFSARDIEIAAGRVEAIDAGAASFGVDNGCAEKLLDLAGYDVCDPNKALDVVAGFEAALLQLSLRSDEFLVDVDTLVESSIGVFTQVPAQNLKTEGSAPEAGEFEIDDETLAIFQEEAEGLLANIRTNLQLLTASPADTNALWEVRRNAHTFKGAAGIVGLKSASSLSHRIEDLLDKVVSSGRFPDQWMIQWLGEATDELEKLTRGSDADALGRTAVPGNDPARPPTPIVRVSLERLDELVTLCRSLVASSDTDHQQLAEEISQKLLRLRMVRFGTLETRLSRAVHVTCQEEDKKADITFVGGDVEIDTKAIDALIEPLLHLLKNAVVHGIEPAETRRLLGKPEKGRIHISVTSGAGGVSLTVRDDGCGISTEKLLQKAIAKEIVTADAAQLMTDADAVELIFHRGLTTAESLSMNAGRGVGMSIVRQAIEDAGGTLAVRSQPQKGTSFTMMLPVSRPAASERNELPNTIPLVLVVDDSESIRRQTAKLVAEAGFRAITAVDGAEALELLLNGLEPVLILSDVEMPNVNGWKLLEYVKTDQNFGHVPVVMVTSLDEEKYRQMASRLGASDYIVKPFSSKDLAIVLDRFCTVAS